jgi:hypothetical protein
MATFVFGWAATAWADGGTPQTLVVARPHDGPRRAIDAPASGLHLEVDAVCEPRQEDAGVTGATCPVVQPMSDVHKELVAIIAPGYSVDVLTEYGHAGTGEERARRVAAELCASAEEPPVIVTFAARRFARARGAGALEICFVTADDRPDVGTIIFRTLTQESLLHIVHPEFTLDLAQEADAVMATLGDPTRTPTPTKPVIPAAAPSRTSPASRNLSFILFVLAVGALVLFALAKLPFIAQRLRGKQPARRRVVKEGERVQLAGSKCTECKRNIVAEKAALHCLECELPVHKDCLARHTRGAHGPAPGVYR